MINPQKLARQFAFMDISTRATQLQRQQKDLDAQIKALSTLESALTDFQSAVDALNSDTDGPVINSVTANNDSATITANSQAKSGTYTFFVDQIASAQQNTYSFADGDIPSSGTFTITMDGSEMDIDLSQSDADGDGTVTVSELADAINNSEDNPGITATIVNTNGSTTLMLTGDETGAANSFNVSTSGIDPNSAFATDISNEKHLSSAQDAIIYLGSSPEDGVKITNSTNTFDDVILGVSMTFTEVSEEGKPITLTVNNDEGASQEKVQTFVDAYNTLIDTLTSLTSHGSDTTSAGAFAGDAGISSLKRQIQNITHADYGGVSILDYGITLDKDGHLQIDSEEFNAAMEENPNGLNSLFVGDNSMTSQIDDLLKTYLNDNDGIIMQRQENIDDRQEQLSNKVDQLKDTYNSSYDRYLSEYTSTLIEIETMAISMAAFA